MFIRVARPEDASGIQRIYEPFVRNTAVTFEYEVPDAAEFAGRIGKTLREYPYLVAEDGGRIAGYAYAGAVRSRAAYKHSVEMSIYLDEPYRGQGMGMLLYERLEELLLRQNVFVAYACITASPAGSDEFVTDASIHFHERVGYSHVGRFNMCGYKFGRWYDVVWMEKRLAPLPDVPGEFIPFPELGESRETSL